MNQRTERNRIHTNNPVRRKLPISPKESHQVKWKKKKKKKVEEEEEMILK